jgi:3-oxoacyl-[acyl-carrier-protein] synthase-3
VLKIISLGHAFPQHTISNKLLNELAGGVASDHAAGVAQRCTVLPEEYLREEKNRNPRVAHTYSSETPTELGVRAARLALQRTEIDASEIGLIIAGTSTPLETCPGESQRIGGALGLKIPAYDINASGIDFGVFFDSLESWQEERMPKYVLCVSTNTPTRRVHYGTGGQERFVLGDGAAAAIVSQTQSGKIALKHTHVEIDAQRADYFTLDAYAEVKADMPAVWEWEDTKQSEMLERALKECGATNAAFTLVGSQLSLEVQKALARQAGLSELQSLENVSRRGYSLGSSAITVLSEAWESLPLENPLIVLLSSPGMAAGYLVFSGEGAC